MSQIGSHEIERLSKYGITDFGSEYCNLKHLVAIPTPIVIYCCEVHQLIAVFNTEIYNSTSAFMNSLWHVKSFLISSEGVLATALALSLADSFHLHQIESMSE